MKTILIPTDYRIESLKHIPGLLNKFETEEVEIIMVHMLSVTDCIRELLMLSRRSAEYKHIPSDFYAVCMQLKKDYPDQLKNIRLEFFYGNTVAVLKNFLEANEVDAVLQIDNYEYRKLEKTSINPVEMIKRLGKSMVIIQSDDLQPKAQPKLQVVRESEPELTEELI